MEQAAQEWGGLNIPRTAQNPCGIGNWGHGLEVNRVVGR